MDVSEAQGTDARERTCCRNAEYSSEGKRTLDARERVGLSRVRKYYGRDWQRSATLAVVLEDWYYIHTPASAAAKRTSKLLSPLLEIEIDLAELTPAERYDQGLR